MKPRLTRLGKRVLPTHELFKQKSRHFLRIVIFFHLVSGQNGHVQALWPRTPVLPSNFTHAYTASASALTGAQRGSRARPLDFSTCRIPTQPHRPGCKLSHPEAPLRLEFSTLVSADLQWLGQSSTNSPTNRSSTSAIPRADHRAHGRWRRCAPLRLKSWTHL